MQHLVKLVRDAAAKVPLAPVPAIDIGTVEWTGELTDLIGLALCSAHRADMARYWDQLLGDPDKIWPIGFLAGEPWKCERLVGLVGLP